MNINVSIIIPAWHEEKFLDDTLASLKTSDYNLKECEVIVVASDDDRTYETAKMRDMAEFGGYAVLRQSPGGKNTALQQGVKISKGEIIVFLDADAIVDKNCLRELIKPIISDKSVCTHGNFFPLTHSWLNPFFMIEKTWGLQIMKRQSTHGKGGIAVKKSIIDEIGIDTLINKRIYVGVDHYFGEQILKNGYEIYFAEKAKTKSYFNNTLGGFIRDNLRWKKGYFRLITKKRLFTIAGFNLAIVLSFIIFLSALIPSTLFYKTFLFSIPFFFYSFSLLVKCTAVSKTASKAGFVFYFPIQVFLKLIDTTLTCHAFLENLLKREQDSVHFKGERE